LIAGIVITDILIKVASIRNHSTVTNAVIFANATSAAFTVTLPSAVGVSGWHYTIKRVSGESNNVTVATTSSQTIDSASTKTLVAKGAYVTVVSDGVGWVIVGQGGTVS